MNFSACRALKAFELRRLQLFPDYEARSDMLQDTQAYDPDKPAPTHTPTHEEFEAMVMKIRVVKPDRLSIIQPMWASVWGPETTFSDHDKAVIWVRWVDASNKWARGESL